MADAVTECGCRKIDSRAAKPFFITYLPRYGGGTVFADISHRMQRIRNYANVLFADALTRFRDGAILMHGWRETQANCFADTWMSWMGPPVKHLAYIGANFSEKRWAVVSNLFGLSIVIVSVGSHHSAGRLERHVQIIEKSFSSIDGSV